MKKEEEEGFTDEFYYLKNNHYQFFLDYYKNIEEREILPNTIYKASIVLMLKPNKNDYRSVSLMTQIFNKNTRKLNTATC